MGQDEAVKNAVFCAAFRLDDDGQIGEGPKPAIGRIIEVTCRRAVHGQGELDRIRKLRVLFDLERGDRIVERRFHRRALEEDLKSTRHWLPSLAGNPDQLGHGQGIGNQAVIGVAKTPERRRIRQVVGGQMIETLANKPTVIASKGGTAGQRKARYQDCLPVHACDRVACQSFVTAAREKHAFS